MQHVKDSYVHLLARMGWAESCSYKSAKTWRAADYGVGEKGCLSPVVLL